MCSDTSRCKWAVVSYVVVLWFVAWLHCAFFLLFFLLSGIDIWHHSIYHNKSTVKSVLAVVWKLVLKARQQNPVQKGLFGCSRVEGISNFNCNKVVNNGKKKKDAQIQFNIFFHVTSKLRLEVKKKQIFNFTKKNIVRKWCIQISW